MTRNRLVFLLLGQSNMAGRGPLDADAGVRASRVLCFTPEGAWKPASDPLHADMTGMGGVGPGMSFAHTVATALPGREIGLVPCAVGNTALARWQQGGDLFEIAVGRSQAACKGGRPAAILWHQGESDAGTPAKAATYGARLEMTIRALRQRLGDKDIPFIAGEIGAFLSASDFPGAATVNAALQSLMGRVPNYTCISTADLTDKGDRKHFDTPSQRILGRRYAAVVLSNCLIGNT